MSMSCSSPPPPALELLDEYWFFSNTLATCNNSAKKKEKPPHPHLRSTATGTGTGTGTGEKFSGSAGPPPSRLQLGGRRLLRTPSLPTSRSRVGMTTTELPTPTPTPTNKDDDGAGAAASASGSNSGNQHAEPQRRQLEEAADEVEVEDDDLNWSSIYEGVLRTRMAEAGGRQSALRRAPSMPMPVHRDWHTTKSTPSMGMGMGMPPARLLRHQIKPPPTATKQIIEQRTPGTGSHENESGHGQPRREVVRSSLRASSSSSQQQPSRGGVLQFQDKKWKSSSDLESIESISPRRPYLSAEAWRPALARAQSTAEIKDQLRMWAQAVACNVRQEC